MKFHTRKTCRLCLSPNIQKVVNLEPVPIAEKYLLDQEQAKNAETFPINIYRCSECAHIQISEVIDPDYLWEGYTYYSGQTQAIIEHFKNFSSSCIHKSYIKKQDMVIDIGSNDGSLLKEFVPYDINVLGIDPAKEVAQSAIKHGIPTITGLFTTDIAHQILTEHGKADLITAFNVFAHTDHMREMLESIRLLLKDNGVFAFEVQYLRDIYKHDILGTFFHEHICHHSVHSIQNFLNSFGLHLIDVEQVNIQKGSIIGYATLKESGRKVSSSVEDILTEEQALNINTIGALKSFGERINSKRKQTEALVQHYKSGQVAGYGAARSGPTLAYNLGLKGKISCLFDDHPMKINRYSPMGGIKVIETASLSKLNPALTVILAYLHSKKIIRKHRDYLSTGGSFLILYPNPTIINQGNVEQYLAS